MTLSSLAAQSSLSVQHPTNALVGVAARVANQAENSSTLGSLTCIYIGLVQGLVPQDVQAQSAGEGKEGRVAVSCFRTVGR